MARPLFVGAGLGLTIGAGCTFLLLSRPTPQLPYLSPSPTLPTLTTTTSTPGAAATAKYGLPISPAPPFIEHDGFLSAYDPRTRNPLWTLEHLTAKNVDGSGDRANSKFRPDPALDQDAQASLDDFRDSGFDRGHMAPVMDHKNSQAATDGTFVLTNVSPQVGVGFNRGTT